MKERDTRVLILTSEQCLKFGFAWVKGCEQGMHFCMVDKEEVIQLILNRLPEEATEAEEAEFETESGSEVQSADVDELEEAVLEFLEEKLHLARIMVMSLQDREILGVYLGQNENQIFTLFNPAATLALMLEDDFDQDTLNQSRQQDLPVLSELDQAMIELRVSYFSDNLSWI